MIYTLKDLCAYFGAETPAQLNRSVYKSTDCGASISIKLRGRPWLHNGAKEWNELADDEVLETFSIQTIIEGSDATVDSLPFHVPVTEIEIEGFLTYMEEEAEALWKEANDE